MNEWDSRIGGPLGSDPSVDNLDRVRWALTSVYRYSTPTRIVEALPHCKKLVQLDIVRSDDHDPVLYIYLGVALTWEGVDYAGAANVPLRRLEHTHRLGMKAPLWVMAARAYALRRLGKLSEAEAMENQAVKFVQTRPSIYNPPVLGRLLVGLGETINAILVQLEG